jgi:hypothetical protein
MMIEVCKVTFTEEEIHKHMDLPFEEPNDEESSTSTQTPSISLLTMAKFYEKTLTIW